MCDGDRDFSERDYSEYDSSGDQAPGASHGDQDHDARPIQRKTGWVIEGRRPEDSQPTGRFLQIGTGQWCPARYATVFPLRKTAIVYAHEFGYSVGHNASIVRYAELE